MDGALLTGPATMYGSPSKGVGAQRDVGVRDLEAQDRNGVCGPLAFPSSAAQSYSDRLRTGRDPTTFMAFTRWSDFIP